MIIIKIFRQFNIIGIVHAEIFTGRGIRMMGIRKRAEGKEIFAVEEENLRNESVLSVNAKTVVDKMPHVIDLEKPQQ